MQSGTGSHVQKLALHRDYKFWIPKFIHPYIVSLSLNLQGFVFSTNNVFESSFAMPGDQYVQAYTGSITVPVCMWALY